MAICTNHRPARTRGGLLGLWITVASCTLACAASADAREPGFYSGGRFHPVIVSGDEFVVEFDSAEHRIGAVRTLRTSAVGSLEEIPWGRSDGRFAILRTSPTDVAVRSRVREMTGIRSIHPVLRTRPGGMPILPTGRIVVRLRDDLTDQERDQLFDDYQLELISPVDGLSDTFIVAPAGDVADTELDTAAALYRDDRTVYAHPDMRFPVRVRQFNTDPFFNQQFHLENNGTQGDAIADADIDILDAWLRTLGGGVIVGQLDDSCDLLHEDLAANYIGISHNVTNNQQSATAANPANPGDRHGTSAIGIAVADIFNGIGVRGVAPDAQFTASGGLLDFVTASQVASAYAFARNQDVDVHNNSWGFVDTANPDVVVDAIETAFREGRDGLGMVICFASGNGAGMTEAPVAEEVFAGEELATLPFVIGVGASNARDVAAVYSNFGQDIDVLAPSNDIAAGFLLPAIVTTDNTDGEFIEPGFNNAGQTDAGGPNLADPAYTNNFGGTSASSPQVAGIVALILALAPNFTATGVQSVIEHTCDKISPSAAQYHGITSRSLRYGYGRVNAGTAVEAVFDGFFWPRRVADVEVVGDTIRWTNDDDIRMIGDSAFGIQTTSVLVVQHNQPFSWTPTDGITYVVGDQLFSPTGQPIDAEVVANLRTELFNFTPGIGTLFFGIYSVTQTPGRGATYGFGVAVDSLGNVTDSGSTMPTDGGGDGGLPPGSTKPNVSISVSPLFGTSPLTVNFMGNAQSSVPIQSFMWDFGDGTTANTRLAQHTYTVPTGSQRFIAELTVTDVEGAIGSRAVAIDVAAPSTGNGDPGDGQTGTITIRISDPAIPGSDISGEGFAPFSVILSAQITGVSFDSLDSPTIFWDLGDGNFATSLSVAHTYQLAGRFPITATVESPSLAAPLRATRFIDVLPSTASPSPTPTATPDNGGSGGGGLGCGIGTVMALWCTLFGMAALRRLR